MIHVGRVAEAEECARTGHEISRAQGERANSVWSARLLGEIAAHDDPQTASELLRDAVDSARAPDLGPQLALCQSSLEKLE